MTFNDIFKSGFLQNVTSISILDMAIAMLLAFALGLFIYLIYKKTYAGVMYSWILIITTANVLPTAKVQEQMVFVLQQFLT